MPDLSARLGPDGNSILFKLRHDDSNLTDPEREALRQAWRDVLGSPHSVVSVAADLSYDGKPLSYTNGDQNKRQIHFKVYNKWVLILGLILLAIILLGFVYLARTSDIIRDSGPPNPPPGSRRPYSLARTQMAFWTLLVLGAFGFIYLVTSSSLAITEQALALLGIAAATALGSVAIDTRKSNLVSGELEQLSSERAKVAAEVEEIDKRITDLEASIDATLSHYTAQNLTPTPSEQEEIDKQKEELRNERIAKADKTTKLEELNQRVGSDELALTQPVSEGFWLDLVTDRGGVTLHRSQIALWTTALGVLFIWEVWQHLAMPAFSTELLALMGISSGTYLGFKFPEKQT